MAGDFAVGPQVPVSGDARGAIGVVVCSSLGPHEAFLVQGFDPVDWDCGRCPECHDRWKERQMAKKEKPAKPRRPEALKDAESPDLTVCHVCGHRHGEQTCRVCGHRESR